MKTLSIIIPHYNTKSLLFRLLDSIKWNNDTEVIVIDDNSSESEFDINELKLKYPSGKFLTNYRNKGAGGARNCGIEKSTGKYLMFADSDDFMKKNYFELFNANKSKDVDIYYFYPTSHNEETGQLGTRHITYLNRLKEFEVKKRKEILYRFFVPWSKVFKKDFIIRNNILFDEVPASNDVMFSLKTSFYSKKVLVIPKEIYVVTESNNSLTNTPTLKNLNSRYNVAIRFNEFLLSKGLSNHLTPMAPHIHSFFKHIGIMQGIKVFFKSLQKKQPIFLGFKHFIKSLRHLF